MNLVVSQTKARYIIYMKLFYHSKKHGEPKDDAAESTDDWNWPDEWCPEWFGRSGAVACRLQPVLCF